MDRKSELFAVLVSELADSVLDSRKRKGERLPNGIRYSEAVYCDTCSRYDCHCAESRRDEILGAISEELEKLSDKELVAMAVKWKIRPFVSDSSQYASLTASEIKAIAPEGTVWRMAEWNAEQKEFEAFLSAAKKGGSGKIENGKLAKAVKKFSDSDNFSDDMDVVKEAVTLTVEIAGAFKAEPGDDAKEIRSVCSKLLSGKTPWDRFVSEFEDAFHHEDSELFLYDELVKFSRRAKKASTA